MPRTNQSPSRLLAPTIVVSTVGEEAPFDVAAEAGRDGADPRVDRGDVGPSRFRQGGDPVIGVGHRSPPRSWSRDDDSATGPIAVRMAGTDGYVRVASTASAGSRQFQAWRSHRSRDLAEAVGLRGRRHTCSRSTGRSPRPRVRSRLPRYARLAAFLAFVGLVTAALAVMVSLPEGWRRPASSRNRAWRSGRSGSWSRSRSTALEARAGRASGLQTDPDAAVYTTSSIYHGVDRVLRIHRR